MGTKNLTEGELFAADIADVLAALIGAAEVTPVTRVWQVRKFLRVETLRRQGGIKVVLGMHCVPTRLEIVVRQSPGDNERTATFDGTYTMPAIGSEPRQISGTARRTFNGVVEITGLIGIMTKTALPANKTQVPR